MARRQHYLQLEASKGARENHMNIKALITTLVLASSSMASADSWSVSGSVSLGNPRPARMFHRSVVAQCQDDRTDSAPGYHPATSRPHQPPIWQAPVYNPTNTIVGSTASQYTGAIYGRQHFNPKALRSAHWFDLTEATRIDAGREVFMLGASKGTFRSLKLEALGNGRSKIDQITIEFADGRGNTKWQVLKLGTWIGRGDSTLTIDLDGGYRQINQIIVYGATDRGSAYKLMAR
jgi:hypothetical protein